MRKVLLSLLIAFCLVSCGGSAYRTDFAPPHSSETDIFPQEIGGASAKVAPLDLGSLLYQAGTADYGGKARVTLVRAQNQGAMDDYVKTVAVPKLDGFPNRFSGRINGAWVFRGHGASGRLYGWQSGSCVFVIEAANDALFEEMVSKLPYISKK